MQLQEQHSDSRSGKRLRFAKKKQPTNEPTKTAWKVLIIDDEPEVHSVTRLALGRLEYCGRGLEYHSAYSAADGRALLKAHPDAAIVLLDVVMESDDAGLTLVPYIRDELKNPTIRIILRTGQPGQAPERSVISHYDINDYKDKSDLTAQKMFTTVMSALRSYRDLRAMEATKHGLEAVIEASATIFQERSMEMFAQGVLEQLVALLELSPHAFYCQLGAFAAPSDNGDLRVIAATGEFSEHVGEDIRHHLGSDVVEMIERALETGESQSDKEKYIGYVETRSGERNLLYVKGGGLQNIESDSLVQLFFRNVSIAFDNLNLQSNLVREVDTRKRKEEENAVLASIPADAPMPVMRISNEGKLIYANDASSPLVKEWDVEVGEDVPDVVAQILDAALEGREPIEFEIPCDDRTLEAVLSPVPNSRFANVYCKDVTDTKKAQAELRHLATHDPLTQLPNRTLFLDHLQAEMAAARRSGALVGVSFLDLDNFKVINDTLGHSAGDDLLRQVSDRLTASVRSGDIVARMGGDEFAILQSRIKAPEAAERQARRIIQALNEPVSLDGRPIQVGCSIGITTYPTDGKSSARLQQNADMAMYLAKSKGRNGFRFYDSDLDERLRRERELEEAMVDGLKNSEFEVHYQPKIDLRNGTVIGAEALLRWIRKDEGFVSPGEFIPAAERSGFITDLGAWVLAEACEQFARWLRQDLNVGTIAVNLSPAQFRDRDLTTLVDHTIGSTGLPPEKLELEITESLAMEEVEETAEVMERLKASGVGLAINDFGTGYSSLSYLRKLPFTALKIDRSFILDVDENEDASSIVQTIVSLGRNMGMRVVAEGIERNSQAERLKTFGCDEAQGFLYSRAIQSSDFEKFLINQAKKDRT